MPHVYNWWFCETAHRTTGNQLLTKMLVRPETSVTSVDHLLELLHRQHPNRFAGRLRLEDTWLLGERVDTLACSHSWLLLQFHVQYTTKLELAILLQFSCCQLQVGCHHCFDILWLQLC